MVAVDAKVYKAQFMKALLERSGEAQSPSIEAIKRHCETLTHVVTQAALRTRSRNHVIERFSRFCAWFAHDHVRSLLQNASTNEGPVHAFFNEFLFREGYLPIVKFSVGRNQPDTLATAQYKLVASCVEPRPDDVLLIEVKQSLDNDVTESELKSWVGQCATYAAEVASMMPSLHRTVYLLIFHSNDVVYGTDPAAIQHQDSVVRPVFVHIGDKTASKRNPVVIKYKV